MNFLNDVEVGKRLEGLRGNKSSRKIALGADIDPSQYLKIEKGELGITNNILNKLVDKYEWDGNFILYGSGTNVPRGTNEYLAERQEKKFKTEKNNNVPFYDAPAMATQTDTDMSLTNTPSGTIDVGDLLNDSEAAIRIYGNSMMPGYPPGCVIGVSLCVDSFIQPGEVYVIETANSRLLKRLFYQNDESSSEMITCYSDNTMTFTGGARNGKLAYPPFDVSRKEIRKIFVVTGVIKRNTNSLIINRDK